MPSSILFSVLNYGVLPFWALLVLAPRARLTERLVMSGLAPGVLALVHLVLLSTTPMPEGAGAHSLAAAQRMFEDPRAAVLCWVHYLSFDLFVGAFLAKDAVRRGIGALVAGPSLLATLFFGPTGALAYAVTAFVHARVRGRSASSVPTG